MRHLRAVEGVITTHGVAAENLRFTIEGSAEEFTTGRGGRYYIEGLAAGRHEAKLGDCRFFLDVPDSVEPLVMLREVACE